jgi:hypothetical protein
MTVRLPDTLLASISRYLMTKKNFRFKNKSELVRDSLYAFHCWLEAMDPDYEPIEKTVDARNFLEMATGGRFMGGRNQCSFESQVLLEETGMQRNLQGRGGSGIDRYENNGEPSNDITKLTENKELTKLAKDVDDTARKMKAEEVMEETLQNIEKAIMDGNTNSFGIENPEEFLKNRNKNRSSAENKRKEQLIDPIAGGMPFKPTINELNAQAEKRERVFKEEHDKNNMLGFAKKLLEEKKDE